MASLTFVNHKRQSVTILTLLVSIALALSVAPGLSFGATTPTHLHRFCQETLLYHFAGDPETGLLREDLVSSPEHKFRVETAQNLTMERLRRAHPHESEALLTIRFELEGYFGPQSAVWEVNRLNPAFLLLPGLIQLYLDLSDPAAAQGVFDHSERLRKNVVLRLFQTIGFLSALNFGTKTEADRLAEVLFRIHSNVNGTIPEAVGRYTQPGMPYSATSARSLAWVHMTHAYTKLVAYEMIFIESGIVKKTPQQLAAFRDQYFEESKILGLLFGVPPRLLPGTYAEAMVFFDTFYQSGYLAYSSAAREIENNVRKQIAQLQSTPIPGLGLFVNSTKWFLEHWVRSHLPQAAEEIFTNGNSGIPDLTLLSRGAIKGFDVINRLSVRAIPTVLLENVFYRTSMARAQSRKPGFIDELLLRRMRPKPIQRK